MFSAGQHRKATKILIRHIIAVNPDVDREKMLRGLKFDKEDLLMDWDLNSCRISVLPRSFSSFGALVCTGYLYLESNQLQCLPAGFGQLEVGRDLYLNRNQLQSLPADFGQLEVGGNLRLNNNQLDSLPEGFETIGVGGELHLYNNQLVEQSCSFPNVQGNVCYEEPSYDDY